MGGMHLSRDSSSLLIMSTTWKRCPAPWSQLLQGVFRVYAGPGTPSHPPCVGNGLWDTQEQPHLTEQWVMWPWEGEPTHPNDVFPSKHVWGTAKSRCSMDGQYQPPCQELVAQVPTFSWFSVLAQASQWFLTTDRYQVSLLNRRRGIFPLAYFTVETWSCCSWNQGKMKEYLISRIMAWMSESMNHCMIFHCLGNKHNVQDIPWKAKAQSKAEVTLTC